MLRIRLKRVGRKHDPSFRVVVVPKKSGPTSGKYVDNLGAYDPRDDSNTVNAERASHWLSVGAQPSDTVHNLFVSEGIIDEDTVNPLPKGTPVVSDEEEESDPDGANESTEADSTSDGAGEAESSDDDEVPTPSENEGVGEESESGTESDSSSVDKEE